MSVHEPSNDRRCNYYVGLRIAESPAHHCTLAFLKDATDADAKGAIAMIQTHLGGHHFSGTTLLLRYEDMFGPHKDIRVRKLSYDTETESGRVVSGLADALYETYGNKDYPQNPHISATGTIQDECIFGTPLSVTGSVIYVKRLGTDARVEFETTSVI